MNIEEFRASLTMRRETMLRMAKRALAGGYRNAWSYYRGYERGLRCALEYLEDVEPEVEVPASFDCPVCKKHVNRYHEPGVSLSCKLIDPNIRSAP